MAGVAGSARIGPKIAKQPLTVVDAALHLVSAWLQNIVSPRKD